MSHSFPATGGDAAFWLPAPKPRVAARVRAKRWWRWGQRRRRAIGPGACGCWRNRRALVRVGEMGAFEQRGADFFRWGGVLLVSLYNHPRRVPPYVETHPFGDSWLGFGQFRT